MAERYRSTTSCEEEILERAARRYFSFPTGTPEWASWIQETSAFPASCELDSSCRPFRMWFNDNGRWLDTSAPEARPRGPLPLMGAVGEDPGVVSHAVERLSERVDALEASGRQIHGRVFSWPEPDPESQVVGTALLVGTPNLPLRIVTYPSFRAFMR
jgi:hypothetical protein